MKANILIILIIINHYVGPSDGLSPFPFFDATGFAVYPARFLVMARCFCHTVPSVDHYFGFKVR